MMESTDEPVVDVKAKVRVDFLLFRTMNIPVITAFDDEQYDLHKDFERSGSIFVCLFRLP